MFEIASNVEVRVRAFVAAINAHDPGAIVARCFPGHLFVDSLGNRLTGEAQLRQAWEWYFKAFPDYRMEIESLALGSDCVLLSGLASATHSGSGARWSIPAAWKATIADENVERRQVCADNKPMYEILNRDG